jgi:putative membrane protein
MDSNRFARAALAASLSTFALGAAAALPAPDQAFVSKVARDGMMEVELGQLAQQKAASDKVKSFGARMATDHATAGDELRALAAKKAVSLPSGMDTEAKKKVLALQKKSGPGFDQDYMGDMVKDHREDVKEFEKQSKSAKDPEVRAWAAKTLPTLQEHLKLAEEAQAAVSK